MIVDATPTSAMLVAGMPRKLRIGLLASEVVIVLAIGSLLVSMAGRPSANPALPNPDGYDDFLHAAALVTGDVGYAANAFDHDRLGALVSTNAEALRLIRLGFSRGGVVPTNSAMTNIAALVAYTDRLRFLPRLLVHEGRLAEMEGRNAEAAQSYVDALGMGTGISRVGSIIHPEYVIAFEAIGVTELTKLVPRLNPEKALLLIPQLEKIDDARMTWEEVRRNERKFPRHELSKGFNPITLIITRWDDWRSIQRAEMIHKDAVARLRLLTAQVALRCYQSAQERVPARLADLVTNYLSKVPQDPCNNQPMIYRPQGTNWLLYSVGPDGVDDGGKPAGQGWPVKGDIRFDSLW